MNTLLNRTGLPASCVWPSDHSISNHLIAPLIALPRYPSASEASDLRRSGLRHFVAGSPDNPAESSSLSLWTDRSFPVASHPLSPRRSYFPIQAGERLPEEDFHLSDQPHSQAHYDGNIFPSNFRTMDFQVRRFSCFSALPLVSHLRSFFCRKSNVFELELFGRPQLLKFSTWLCLKKTVCPESM
jgi:hypothetical protein